MNFSKIQKLGARKAVMLLIVSTAVVVALNSLRREAESKAGSDISGETSISGSTRSGSGSDATSARAMSISLEAQFKESLEDGDRARVKELLPRIHQDHLFKDKSIYAKFLWSVADYPPDEVAAILSLWPEDRPKQADGSWVRMPGIYEAALDVWDKSIRDSMPADQRFEKALQVIRNFKPDHYVRRQWMKKMLSDTPGFSMAHLKELQKLQLSREDKRALYNILINAPDNLDQELYGKSYEELGLDWQ